MGLQRTLCFFFLVALMHAQSSGGRTYATGEAWWNAGWGGILPWDENYDNPDGQVSIKNRSGAIRTKDHAFFDPIGTNGRACVTCHQPASAMGLGAATIRQRWIDTKGTDPVFAAFDGSNCPSLPQGLASSHSLTIEYGLFRIALPWPPKDVPKPEIRIEVERDPGGCNALGSSLISVYRRPRVVANLDTLLSGPGSRGPVFMADGREPSLESQARNATLGHEQAAAPPTEEQLRQIVEFEKQIYASQNADIRGGLFKETALGVENLARGKAASLSLVAVSFDGWRNPPADMSGVQREFRASVMRGNELFFGRSFGAAKDTCATCHNSGTTRWMNIGTTTAAASVVKDLPVFKVTCEASGKVVRTVDPGRALVSGKCEDVGAIVVQQFRGLSGRAPYFASGLAKDLESVVDYYDRRYGIGLSDAERRDLANFLRVL